MSRPEFDAPAPVAVSRAAMTHQPDWLRENLAVPFERHFREVEGAQTELLAWGPREAPALLLLHGSLASAEWWRPFAPHFADCYRVVAPSLTGMGGSDWREHYSVEQFRRELLDAIAFAAPAPPPPLLIAHSYGTWPAILAAQDRERLAGLILVDPPLPVIPMPSAWEGRNDVRLFHTRDAAIRQFRLTPDDFPHRPELVRFIAEQSVTRQGDRWRWRFDPKLRAQLRHQSRPNLAEAACPVAVMIGAESVVAANCKSRSIREVFPNVQILRSIADAGHHVMLDQPLAFLRELKALIAGFEAGRTSGTA